MQKLCLTLEAAKQMSPVVKDTLRAGGSPEDVICGLVNLNMELAAQLAEQGHIVPVKIKAPDGRVMIWRCPDEFIPMASPGMTI